MLSRGNNTTLEGVNVFLSLLYTYSIVEGNPLLVALQKASRPLVAINKKYIEQYTYRYGCRYVVSKFVENILLIVS